MTSHVKEAGGEAAAEVLRQRFVSSPRITTTIIIIISTVLIDIITYTYIIVKADNCTSNNDCQHSLSTCAA